MSTEIQKFKPEISFTQEQISQLKEPLDANLIDQRPDGKKYLRGSTEFEAANRIFGEGKWGYRVISRTLQKSYDLEEKITGYYFYVELELYVAGAMFPIHGDGGQSVRYFTPQGFEDASKGATTDAVKRALRHYGDQFGLCLYNEDSLVDAGDGVMKRVKEVKVNKNKSDNKKTVDEHPEKISDLQKESIQKLCDMLNTPMPEKVNDLGFLEARELIIKLKEKYREMKAQEPADQGMTVKGVFEHCSQAGLIKSKNDFYRYASEALGFAVTAENIMSLTQEQLIAIFESSNKGVVA
jgi:DNA repair and recombination protein RAD52